MRIRAFIALFLPFLAFAQLTTPPVTVNTNGVLLFPTNFFVANSNALVAVSGTGSGSAAGKLDANGGTATNLTFTGTSAFTGPITSASTITLSSQRIIGVASPSGSADAANKLYVDNKFANTTLTGTTVADLIQGEAFQSAQVANQSKIAYWDSNGVLTNQFSWNDVTNMVTQIAADVSGAGGTSTLTQYVPTTYYDAADGTVNTNAVATKTASIQAAIDAASAAYNTNTGARVTLVFQPGSIHVNQLTLMPNVIYKAAGEVTIWRATDYSGLDRGILATRRVDGVDIHYSAGSVNAFKAWKNSPADYSNPDNWYGLSSNIRFSGPGKFLFKVGDKVLNQPPLYLNEVDNFFVEPGAIEVWHGTNTLQWGIVIGGRNVFWQNPIVRNGTLTGQDGLHIINGRKQVYIGGILEAGDDAICIGRAVNGVSNVGPDEACEDIALLGQVCDSERGRAFAPLAGYNFLDVPFSEGRRVRRVSVLGISGHCAKSRSSGFYFGDYQQRQKIYHYTVDSPGSLYPNGYSKCPVIGGGGAGAECVIYVSGGQILGAWPSYNSGVSWNNGTGYSSNGTVDLSGLSSGSGGVVTAVYQPYDNSLVENIFVQGEIKIGSASHDGTEPYGINIEGCRNITMDVGILAVQNSGTPAHRPMSMLSGENLRIRLRTSGAWNKSGVINSAAWAGSVIDRIYIENGSYLGTIDSSSAVFKLTGNIGSVTFQNNTFNEIRNNCFGIYSFDRETGSSPYTYITNLAVLRNTFVSYSASPSGTYGFVLSNNTNTASVGTLLLSGNDFSRITSHTSGATLRSDVEHWRIMDNTGFVTRNRQTATIASGATTAVVTIGTATGFPDTTDEGIACINAVPVGNWGSATKWWITPTSATTYTINVDSAPGGSGLKFALNEDTSLKE